MYCGHVVTFLCHSVLGQAITLINAEDNVKKNEHCSVFGMHQFIVRSQKTSGALLCCCLV
jgi:hypothetical protein